MIDSIFKRDDALAVGDGEGTDIYEIIDERTTSDGLLTFRVERDDDGDILLGFDGYEWHTHGDLLVGWDGYGPSVDDAAKQFVDDLVAGKHVIVVLRVNGEIQDVWVTDEPAGDRRYMEPGETLVFRYWDGRKYHSADES